MTDNRPRAISLRSPLPQAIIYGVPVAGSSLDRIWCDIINRTWATGHRGLLYIHVAQRVDSDPVPAWAKPAVPPWATRGMIIGHVRLLECTLLKTESHWAQKGTWHWVVCAARSLEYPVPCPGKSKLWVVPDDVAASLPPSGGWVRPHP